MSNEILIVIMIILALFLGYIFFLRPGSQLNISGKISRSFGRRSYKKRLINICFGDEKAAERLMRCELERDPRISQGDAYKRAVQRYLRHNR